MLVVRFGVEVGVWGGGVPSVLRVAWPFAGYVVALATGLGSLLALVLHRCGALVLEQLLVLRFGGADILGDGVADFLPRLVVGLHGHEDGVLLGSPGAVAGHGWLGGVDGSGRSSDPSRGIWDKGFRILRFCGRSGRFNVEKRWRRRRDGVWFGERAATVAAVCCTG